MTPYVTNEYRKLRQVLLCRPDHFFLQPINEIAAEFIRQGKFPDPQRCQKEHQEFAEAIASTGTEVIWVEPQEGMPYQVFTRDIGVTTQEGVLLGVFFRPVRRGEEEAAAAVLEPYAPIWKSVQPREGLAFEGGDATVKDEPIVAFEGGDATVKDEPIVAFEGGDFMYMDERTVALGMGARTTLAGAERVRAMMAEVGVEVILVPFDPRYLHIDMVFNVVGPQVAVACLEALPEDFLRLVRQHGFELIEEPAEGVFKLNCNLLALDEGVVLSAASNRNVNSRLKVLGFQVLEVDLRDLLMGGGGPHCMSFPMRRD